MNSCFCGKYVLSLFTIKKADKKTIKEKKKILKKNSTYHRRGKYVIGISTITSISALLSLIISNT